MLTSPSMAPPLTTDSPLSRRIVRAFLDFLTSVEPAPGVNSEGIEIARECLGEAFKLDTAPAGEQIKPDSLVDIFSSLEKNKLPQNSSDHGQGSVPAPSSSAGQETTAATNIPKAAASKSLGEDSTSKKHEFGESKDTLFGQFFSALEDILFFKTLPDGSEDPVRLEKATQLFHDALNEMERSECKEFSPKSLAETLKSQGNKAMQSKLYLKAIELYDCAIALNGRNAVYQCNRAAAYTQLHKYHEAVSDCLRSIQIDPNYSKAYNRLGSAYYALGNYREAIDRGYKKALQLDPDNEAVKENLRVAELKLREQQQHRSGFDQNTSSFSFTNGSASEHQNQSTGGSRGPGAPPSFGSMPFNTSSFPFGGSNGSMPFDTSSFPFGGSDGSVPVDFAHMFTNMASNAQDNQGGERNTDGADEPEIRIGGNLNVNFGEMPEELSGALRSVMHMFSGAVPGANMHGNSQDTPPNEGPRPNE